MKIQLYLSADTLHDAARKCGCASDPLSCSFLLLDALLGKARALLLHEGGFYYSIKMGHEVRHSNAFGIAHISSLSCPDACSRQA